MPVTRPQQSADRFGDTGVKVRAERQKRDANPHTGQAADVGEQIKQVRGGQIAVKDVVLEVVLQPDDADDVVVAADRRHRPEEQVLVAVGRTRPVAERPVIFAAEVVGLPGGRPVPKNSRHRRRLIELLRSDEVGLAFSEEKIEGRIGGRLPKRARRHAFTLRPGAIYRLFWVVMAAGVVRWRQSSDGHSMVVDGVVVDEEVKELDLVVDGNLIPRVQHHVREPLAKRLDFRIVESNVHVSPLVKLEAGRQPREEGDADVAPEADRIATQTRIAVSNEAGRAWMVADAETVEQVAVDRLQLLQPGHDRPVRIVVKEAVPQLDAWLV